MDRVLPSLFGLLAIVPSTSAQPCGWEHVLSPVVPNARATPFGMDASGPGDVWVVGERVVGDYPFWEYHNYAARFDGASWVNVPVPSLDAAGDHNELSGVVAFSPDEAYAGGSTKWMGSNQAQIFRWDGSEWTLEALNVINAVGYVGGMGRAGEVPWAVGSRTSEFDPPATSGVALALRRDGGQWIPEPVEPLAAFGRSINTLAAIDGVAHDDAWAVGHARQVFTPGPSFAFSRYIVRWDGDAWTLDRTLPFLERSQFEDVEMAASDKGWAVGYKALPGTNQPMIAEWDGSAWTETALDPLPGVGGILRGIAVVSPDEAYALGVLTDAADQAQLLIYRYDGASWSRMDPAPTAGVGNQFMAATSTPDGTIWGAGIYVRSDSGPLTQRLACDTTCDADLAPPFGVLNFFDLAAYIALFSAGDPAADLAPPEGVLNFFDVSAYLSAFNAGCP